MTQLIELAEPEDQRFSETFFLVSASDFEKFNLWERWEKLVEWRQDTIGAMGQIGMLGNRPVTLSVSWAQINGKLVAFWESPSQVTDNIMAENWLRKHCSLLKCDNGMRCSECNAANFHLCIDAIHKAS